MIVHPDNEAILLTSAGNVVRYAWPGGYPVFYITSGGDALCPPCVQEELNQCIDPDSGGWLVTAHGVNWEDPHLYCDSCSARIESAYADEEVAP